MPSHGSGSPLFKARVRRQLTSHELGLIVTDRLVLTSRLLFRTLTGLTTRTLIEIDLDQFNLLRLTLQSTRTPVETTTALTRQDRLINQTLLPLKVQLLELDVVHASHESSKWIRFFIIPNIFWSLLMKLLKFTVSLDTLEELFWWPRTESLPPYDVHRLSNSAAELKIHREKVSFHARKSRNCGTTKHQSEPS